MTTVSLPMYDLPELRQATDALWQGLARAFRRAGIADVPDSLDRTPCAENPLRRADLLFSQTCGYPLVCQLAGVVRLVATPCFDLPGCGGPNYASAIVARADDPAGALADFKGRVCAVNGPGSHSGYNALRHRLAPLASGQAFFSKVVQTGSHPASVAAVASGEADLAAIDCVTLGLLGRARPEAVSGLKVIAWSESAPGLPFVTRAGAEDSLVARLREGLKAAFDDPTLEGPRAALSLTDVDILERPAYDRISEMERQAVELGYPKVA